jgi:formylglycine-generating enzyme required for sulfatase activity
MYSDWGLLEEWAEDSGKKLADLMVDGNALRGAFDATGVKPVDLVLILQDRGTGQRGNKNILVELRPFGETAVNSYAMNLLVEQWKPSVGALESGFEALCAGTLDEAARIFENSGKKTYVRLTSKLREFQKAYAAMERGSEIVPKSRDAFVKSAVNLISDIILWMPSPDDKRISKESKGLLQQWLGEVEANLPTFGGNKRDLVAILNLCRQLDSGLGLPLLKARHPNAVWCYANYSEKYRRTPAWAIPVDVWIDAETGFSTIVELRTNNRRFIFIPHGAAYFGNAVYGKRIKLSGFFIQENEVSNKEFLQFCDETGWQRPEHLVRREGPNCHEDQPVTNVSFLDAANYCKWLNRKINESVGTLRWKCRLPSEAQWERACRLNFPFTYPWGQSTENVDSLARRKLGAPEKVMRLSHDISIAGVMGLGGNVSEWCIDGWSKLPGTKIMDGAVDPVLDSTWDTRKVSKGACYFSEDPSEFQIHTRQPFEPGNRDKWLGFRPVIFMKGESKQ